MKINPILSASYRSSLKFNSHSNSINSNLGQIQDKVSFGKTMRDIKPYKIDFSECNEKREEYIKKTDTYSSTYGSYSIPTGKYQLFSDLYSLISQGHEEAVDYYVAMVGGNITPMESPNHGFMRNEAWMWCGRPYFNEDEYDGKSMLNTLKRKNKELYEKYHQEGLKVKAEQDKVVREAAIASMQNALFELKVEYDEDADVINKIAEEYGLNLKECNA